jgi:hypothetical protein
MAVTINASSVSGLQMTSDLSGQLQFQNNGVNLPMGGVAPAFSAYANASQTVTNNVFTKVTFQVEDFDTNNNFASSTFTPTVAGYYQVNAILYLAGGVATTQTVLALFKNGNNYQRLFDLNPSASLTSNSFTVLSGSTLIYMNGSTDNIEIYGYYFGGTSTFSINNTTLSSRFSASLVRGA